MLKKANSRKEPARPQNSWRWPPRVQSVLVGLLVVSRRTVGSFKEEEEEARLDAKKRGELKKRRKRKGEQARAVRAATTHNSHTRNSQERYNHSRRKVLYVAT